MSDMMFAPQEISVEHPKRNPDYIPNPERREALKKIGAAVGALGLTAAGISACSPKPAREEYKTFSPGPTVESTPVPSPLEQAIKNEGGMLLDRLSYSMSVTEESLGVDLGNGQYVPNAIKEGGIVNVGTIKAKFNYSEEVFQELSLLNAPISGTPHIGDMCMRFFQIPKSSYPDTQVELRQYDLPIYSEGDKKVLLDDSNIYGVVPIVTSPAAPIYAPQIENNNGTWATVGEVGKSFPIDSNNPSAISNGSWSFALMKIGPNQDENGLYTLQFLGIVNNERSNIYMPDEAFAEIQ